MDILQIDNSYENKSLQEIYESFLEFRFPDEEIKEVNFGGRKYHTINSMAVVKKLNDAFGLGGWNVVHELVKESESITAKGKTKYDVVVKGKLILKKFDFETPEQYGGSDSHDSLADAYKGAVTNLISKTASYIGLGSYVWLGKMEQEKPKATTQEVKRWHDFITSGDYESAENMQRNFVFPPNIQVRMEDYKEKLMSEMLENSDKESMIDVPDEEVKKIADKIKTPEDKPEPNKKKQVSLTGKKKIKKKEIEIL